MCISIFIRHDNRYITMTILFYDDDESKTIDKQIFDYHLEKLSWKKMIVFANSTIVNVFD